MVANRTPIVVEKNKGQIEFVHRNGGFASGLTDFYEKNNCNWIGWPGITEDELSANEKEKVRLTLKDKKCFPVYIEKHDIENHYYGFSTKTLWPIYHYFLQNATFNTKYWNSYKRVNEQFADYIATKIEDGDQIWIHDYHLLLLPQLLRAKFPKLKIGLFTQVPFPSYELFRALPWRIEILEGMLGADLIGFQTYDYERHFLSCVQRLMGLDSFFNRIRYDERILLAGAFPMGIDYNYHESMAMELIAREKSGQSSMLHQRIWQQFHNEADKKIIVSIDRLDYTKGFPERLLAFEKFLSLNSQAIEKVSLVLGVIPSRENISEYKKLKKEIDGIVGRINGRFGTMGWMPIWYLFHGFSKEEQSELYAASDIALVTPLRDGMNLGAKEYVASRPDKTGVLILSELAGSAKEMTEALIVNPNNIDEIVGALEKAIAMPKDEQMARIEALQARLRRWDEERWATDFMEKLNKVKALQEKKLTKKINEEIEETICKEYDQSGERIIFLDYDGTLAGFNKDPQKASPDKELYDILKKLTSDTKNNVIIISGRDKETLSKWFNPEWKITFIAEHGVWFREPGTEWHMLEEIDRAWKEQVKPMLDLYSDRTPRSFTEVKNYSLAWHYRDADPDLGKQRSWELKDELMSMAANLNLEILDGDKVIEIKYSGVNKGRAASLKLAEKSYNFIMAIGDDWTDEYTFKALPKEANSIKVGVKHSAAKYYLESVENVRELLKKLIG
jgi:trehalose 6-phosphate synthase/phosphatase